MMPGDFLELVLTLHKKAEGVSLDPRSVRVVVGGESFSPTRLRIANWPAIALADASESGIPVEDGKRVTFMFESLGLPDRFTVVVGGLPSVDFEVTTVTQKNWRLL